MEKSTRFCRASVCVLNSGMQKGVHARRVPALSHMKNKTAGKEVPRGSETKLSRATARSRGRRARARRGDRPARPEHTTLLKRGNDIITSK